MNANFEASWAPAYKLDGSPGLDGSNGCIDVFSGTVSPPDNRQQATICHSEGLISPSGWLTESMHR